MHACWGRPGDDQKILYRLDDGTGLIHVTKWVKKDTDSVEDAANLGDLVTVRGKIRVYKELSAALQRKATVG